MQIPSAQFHLVGRTFSEMVMGSLSPTLICAIMNAPSGWQAKGFSLRIKSLCHLISTLLRYPHHPMIKATKFISHIDTSLA